MNKKIMEKITTIALAIISLLFVVLLIITAFGKISNEDLDNKIVQSLLIALACVFAILSVININLSFKDDEKLRTVLIFKDRESATQATVGVMKKTAVRVCKPIEEAKIKKVTIFADSVGDVTMHIDIKVFSDDTIEVITKTRATIMEAFKEIFGIEFSAINYKLVKSKNAFIPPADAVDKKTEELKKDITLNKPMKKRSDKKGGDSNLITPPEAEKLDDIKSDLEENTPQVDQQEDDGQELDVATNAEETTEESSTDNSQNDELEELDKQRNGAEQEKTNEDNASADDNESPEENK